MARLIEHLGAEAVIYPGQTKWDHARVAIQVLSGPIPTRVAYVHTGWRRIGGGWCYLHANGVIGQGDAEVILDEPLSRAPQILTQMAQKPRATDKKGNAGSP